MLARLTFILFNKAKEMVLAYCKEG